MNYHPILSPHLQGAIIAFAVSFLFASVLLYRTSNLYACSVSLNLFAHYSIPFVVIFTHLHPHLVLHQIQKCLLIHLYIPGGWFFPFYIRPFAGNNRSN